MKNRSGCGIFFGFKEVVEITGVSMKRQVLSEVSFLLKVFTFIGRVHWKNERTSEF